MEIAAFLLFAGALVAIVGYVSHVQEQRRMEAMRAAAERLGLAFEADGAARLEGLQGLDLATHGRAKQARNVIHGTVRGVHVEVFDYRYTTGSGKNRRTWTQTVVLLKDAARRLPGFVLRPETFFHRLGQVFGYQDIDFDTHPRFSETYLLRSDDEAAVRAIFTPPVLEWFEANPGLSVEGAGPRLLVYRANRQASADEVRALIDEAIEVHALFAAGATRAARAPS